MKSNKLGRHQICLAKFLSLDISFDIISPTSALKERIVHSTGLSAEGSQTSAFLSTIRDS